MAISSSRRVLVFGLGMVLLVSLWCMKATEASNDDDMSDSGVTIHAVRREEGCNSKQSSDNAPEECTDEDDHLGLYADVDDTFRGIKKTIFSHVQEGSSADYDDSPDVSHNNVNVLGH
ncbi:hypothetical protein SESBI_38615 [Sesbania bispinosa]|nr:hypothetical protein SESBI_38615 [Sesbania bispinosa]